MLKGRLKNNKKGKRKRTSNNQNRMNEITTTGGKVTKKKMKRKRKTSNVFLFYLAHPDLLFLLCFSLYGEAVLSPTEKRKIIV
jgi:hypothetical protein